MLFISLSLLPAVLLNCSSATVEKDPENTATPDKHDTNSGNTDAVAEAKEEYEEYLKIKDELERQREERKRQEELQRREEERKQAEIAATLEKEKQEERLKKEKELAEERRREEEQARLEREKELERQKKEREQLEKERKRKEAMDRAESEFATVIEDYEKSVTQTKIDKRLEQRELVLDRYDPEREAFWRVDSQRRFGREVRFHLSDNKINVYKGYSSRNLKRFATDALKVTDRIRTIEVSEKETDLFSVLPESKGNYILTSASDSSKPLVVTVSGSRYILRELFFDGYSYMRIYLESVYGRSSPGHYHVIAPEEVYISN